MATFVVEAEANIQASVDGVPLPSTISWSSFAGGDAQASTSQLLPGGMQPSIALPGPATRTNVTVKRPYTNELHAFVPQLEAKVGRAPAQASYAPTDANGNVIGAVVTRTGILKEVQVPDWDAKNGAEGYLGLVLEVGS